MQAEKQTTNAQRAILYIASALVLIMGIILYFLSDKTETYFAWTISVPLTAAFLGGGYLASFLLEFLSAREKIWAKSRIAVPAVLLFTALTFIVTLFHLDKFHLNSSSSITIFLTWAWIVVYAVVPFAMALILFLQLKTKAQSSARIAPLPTWFRLILGIQAAVMLLLGLAFLFMTENFMGLWAWQLTPLTARAIAAWLLGMGIAVAQSVQENDWSRLRAVMFSYAIYGLLQIINLIRYPNAEGLDWTQAKTWFYLAFVLSILLIAAYGSWKAQNLNAAKEGV